MKKRTTHWFDPSSRTLYSVSGTENYERMEDIVRGARFSGVTIRSVGVSWVRYTRKHDPFAAEIGLVQDTETPCRTMVRTSIAAMGKKN